MKKDKKTIEKQVDERKLPKYIKKYQWFGTRKQLPGLFS